MNDERVSVHVHIEIDGEEVVSDIYETNSRERAASDLEDWAEQVRDAEVSS